MPQVVSNLKSYPIGPLRAVIVTVTHDSVTSSTLTRADHGLTNIEFAIANSESTNDTDFTVQKNTNSGGSAIGSVYTTGVTAGNVLTYYILGN